MATSFDAKDQVQDYAFNQRFASVIHNHDKTYPIIVFEYTEPCSHIKNWKKTPLEEKKQINNKISANCPFLLRIIQKKNENVCRIVKYCLDYNDLMNPDLFQFQEYWSCNLDFDKAFSYAIGH